MNTPPRALGAVGLIAVVVLMVACGSSSTSATSSTSGATRSTTTTTSSSATSGASSPGSVATTTVASGPIRAALHQVIYLNDPIAMVTRHGSSLLYAADKSGQIWALRPHGATLAKVGSKPVLDVSGDIVASGEEQGLLGLAFSPDGTALYIDETASGGTAGITKVIRYTMAGDSVVRSSATTLMTLPQPFDNHNGGEVVFGPDGALYVGVGDGGSEGDPLNYGQNPKVLFSKILRMEPDGSNLSTWLMGVRNPWRFSFDSATGDLWIGDVGGSEREEVDHLPGTGPTSPGGHGANLGWSLREGTINSDKQGNRNGFTDPVYEYSHDDGGCAIVGGYVYHGTAIPTLDGRYVFGDFCLKTIQALDPAHPQNVLSIARGDSSLTSFAVDNDGELYALSLSGPIYRLERATS